MTESKLMTIQVSIKRGDPLCAHFKAGRKTNPAHVWLGKTHFELGSSLYTAKIFTILIAMPHVPIYHNTDRKAHVTIYRSACKNVYVTIYHGICKKM